VELDSILLRTEQGEPLKTILADLGIDLFEFQKAYRKNPQMKQRYQLSKDRQRTQRKTSDKFCQQCRDNRAKHKQK